MATSPGASGAFDLSPYTAAQRVQFSEAIWEQGMTGNILLDPANGFLKKQTGKTPVLSPFIYRPELFDGTGMDNSGKGVSVRSWISFAMGGGTFPRGVNLKAVAHKMGGYTHYDQMIYENWFPCVSHYYGDTTNQTQELVNWMKANAQIADRIGFLHELNLILHLAGYNPTLNPANAYYVDAASGQIDVSDPTWVLNGPRPTDFAAASPYRIWPVATGVSAEQSITSSHPLTTDQIRRAVARCRRPNSTIAPFKYKGMDLYLLIVHQDQYAQLLDDTDFKNVNWYGPAVGGRDPGENPRVTGKVCQWEDVLIIQHPYVPFCIADDGSPFTTARRAILCGAQAAVLASGKKGAIPGVHSTLDFRFDSENFDQENYVATIFWSGVQRVIYEDNRDATNTERQHTLILPSYTGTPVA